LTGPLARRPGVFKSYRSIFRLAKERRDNLLDQHRARIDPVEIAVAIIIIAVRIEAVLRAQVVRNLVVSQSRAVAGREALADIVQLLRLARRNARNGFLGEAGRTSPVAVADGTLKIVSMGIAVAVARLGGGGGSDTERGRPAKRRSCFIILELCLSADEQCLSE